MTVTMNCSPPAEAEIVRANLADLPALARLAEVIWREAYAGIISAAQIDYMLAKMYAVPKLQDEIQSQGIIYFRLLVQGEFTGFAALGPLDSPARWKLHKLYLLPSRHGQGLGTKLLQHCEHEARSAGATELRLNVNKQNAKAIAAYQRNGFQIAESVRVEIGGGFVMDDFVMAKDLTGPRKDGSR